VDAVCGSWEFRSAKSPSENLSRKLSWMWYTKPWIGSAVVGGGMECAPRARASKRASDRASEIEREKAGIILKGKCPSTLSKFL
jgi:hypothetical protein